MGTTIGPWHLGHLTFLPAAASGAFNLAEQPGQTTEMGTTYPPKFAQWV
jgi:hypothetical protein